MTKKFIFVVIVTVTIWDNNKAIKMPVSFEYITKHTYIVLQVY